MYSSLDLGQIKIKYLSKPSSYILNKRFLEQDYLNGIYKMNIKFNKLSTKQQHIFISEYVRFLRAKHINQIRTFFFRIIKYLEKNIFKKYVSEDTYLKSSRDLKVAKQKTRDNLHLAMIDTLINMNSVTIKHIRSSKEFDTLKDEYEKLVKTFLKNPTFTQVKNIFPLEKRIISICSRMNQALINKVKYQKDLIGFIKEEEGVESEKDLQNVLDGLFKDLSNILTDKADLPIYSTQALGTMFGKWSSSVLMRKSLLNPQMEKAVVKLGKEIEDRKSRLNTLVNKVNKTGENYGIRR